MAIQPQLIQALIVCLLLSVVYAFALSTKLGRYLCAEQTWLTVVAGTLLVLGCMAYVDADAALLALSFFVAGGIPMIARSVYIQFQHYIANTADYSARGEADND